MAHEDPRRADRAKFPAFMALLTLALAVLAGIAIYAGARELRAISRDVVATRPDYERCREMAARLKEMERRVNALDAETGKIGASNGWLPSSGWRDADWARYSGLRAERDKLAREHNELANGYFEVMRQHDMRFADPARLPPDADDVLPYYFYPIFRIGDDSR